MRKPTNVKSGEDFGRIRLSRNFFMREFLHSEIASMHGFDNLPNHPELAVQVGRQLCETLLEPLQATFGRISIRSGYRSPAANQFGNEHNFSCANNRADRAGHIWDEPDDAGCVGAMATIVVPWLLDRAQTGTPWQAMAWWIHDHLPYSKLQFFLKLLAFNIGWHEKPARRITSYVAPRGLLTKPGLPNHDGDHQRAYPGFPPLRAAER